MHEAFKALIKFSLIHPEEGFLRDVLVIDRLLLHLCFITFYLICSKQLQLQVSSKSRGQTDVCFISFFLSFLVLAGIFVLSLQIVDEFWLFIASRVDGE